MKQQQLTFEKGMSNVPSDALSSDHCLEYAEGMIYRDGEHKVIQKGEVQIHSYGIGVQNYKATLLFVHTYNGQKRYICAKHSLDIVDNEEVLRYHLVYGDVQGKEFLQHIREMGYVFDDLSNAPKFTTIGKTLIMSTTSGLVYYLLKDGEYTTGFTDIPVPEVEFSLEGVNDSANIVSEYAVAGDALYNPQSVWKVNPLYKDEWNNVVLGLYSKLKKDLHQKKRFWGSFSIRVALKMYDDSYHYISNPIMMMNQFQAFCVADITAGKVVTMTMQGQELKYELKTDYSGWEDLVSGIVFFVSREADNFDTSSDAICNLRSGHEKKFYCISGNTKASSSYTVTSKYEVLNNFEDEAMKRLVEDGVFYELCTINLTPNIVTSIDTFITTHTLETLTSQTQLGEDDYYGHCRYIPSYVYSYNSRLNMANVSRSVFYGFSYFLPYNSYHLENGTIVLDSHTYRIFVRIATDSGDRVVMKEIETSQKQGIWFYYPDPRAKHVIIIKDNTRILDEELKEHPTLNGAYWFKGPLTSGEDEPSSTSGTTSMTVNTAPEILPNYIITSEVNNPFIFNAAGYYKVGTGKILAMSTITQALSEGQFGQFPLLVFSESGIWTLTVGSTGYYTNINPMSREVSLDPARIVQTDGAVFFISKKGLMMVSGNRVICVSEQMNGKTSGSVASAIPYIKNFCDFLSTAFMAYDYRDSLLWIFAGVHTENGVQVNGSRYCYVYSIKSGTFGMFDFGTFTYNNVEKDLCIQNVVNYYPDNLIQDNYESHNFNCRVYSLYNRADINTEAEITGANAVNYSAVLKSRPLKLENAFALKRIIQMKHVANISGSLTVVLKGSNDLIHWCTLTSLRGVPWKYYRIEYSFSGLKATDSFSGTMLVTEDVRTNKLR